MGRIELGRAAQTDRGLAGAQSDPARRLHDISPQLASGITELRAVFEIGDQRLQRPVGPRPVRRGAGHKLFDPRLGDILQHLRHFTRAGVKLQKLFPARHRLGELAGVERHLRIRQRLVPQVLGRPEVKRDRPRKQNHRDREQPDNQRRTRQVLFPGTHQPTRWFSKVRLRVVILRTITSPALEGVVEFIFTGGLIDRFPHRGARQEHLRHGFGGQGRSRNRTRCRAGEIWAAALLHPRLRGLMSHNGGQRQVLFSDWSQFRRAPLARVGGRGRCEAVPRIAVRQFGWRRVDRLGRRIFVKHQPRVAHANHIARHKLRGIGRFAIDLDTIQRDRRNTPAHFLICDPTMDRTGVRPAHADVVGFASAHHQRGFLPQRDPFACSVRSNDLQVCHAARGPSAPGNRSIDQYQTASRSGLPDTITFDFCLLPCSALT